MPQMQCSRRAQQGQGACAGRTCIRDMIEKCAFMSVAMMSSMMVDRMTSWTWGSTCTQQCLGFCLEYQHTWACMSMQSLPYARLIWVCQSRAAIAGALYS